MKRRTWLLGTALGTLASGALAQPPAPIARLRMLIPANTGGGWDQTGRALGEALVASGQAGGIDYENKGGKGGVLGLAQFVAQRGGDASALMIGGFVMVGSIALNRPPHDLTSVTPIARLTTELPVLVVRADAPLRDLRLFTSRLRTEPAAVTIAGGSAGGVDHLCAALIARAIGAHPATLAYRPFASGAEVLRAVEDGRVAAAISGYGELQEGLASGRLRALGVAARRAAMGVPSLREQGIDVEIGNWRGVFAPAGLQPAQVARLRDAVQAATQHALWKDALQRHRWQPAWLTGAPLREAIELDQTMARVLVHVLKLQAS